MAIPLRALDKIMLSRASARGSISFHGATASEMDVYLDVLYRLEERGALVRDKGNSPLRPFLLTRAGMALRTLMRRPART